MQIHELNKKPTNISEQQVNEVDLFGPQGIVSVGKQVLKNPKSWIDSSALGAAKQASTQQSSTDSAKQLAAKGYTVGGSIKPTITTAQQMAANKSNTAVQQQVNNLASQWVSQSAALKQKQQAAPVTEADATHVVFDPRELAGNPKYATVLSALQKQGVDPKAEVELEKELTSWERNFKAWADPRVSAGGVSVDKIEQDPATSKLLTAALAKVAVAAQSGNANLEKEAAAEYFNIAIAGIQAYINNAQSKQAAASRVSARPGAAATPTGQDPADVLKQYGLTLAPAQVTEIAAAMTRAGSSKIIKNTGNDVLNAIAQLAGFQVTNT